MKAPGGNLIAGAGSYLQLWNWKAVGSSTAPPSPTNYRWLDVAWAVLHRQRITKRLAYSGCFGSNRRRFISRDWSITCRVWWDWERPPEMQLTDGDTMAVKLVIGNESTWQGSPYLRKDTFEQVGNPTATNQAIINPNGRGILATNDQPFVPSYCAPQALLTVESANLSSTGDEDGIVWQDVTIEGDSNLYYIFSQPQADFYADYVTKLNGQGFLAFS